VLFLNADVADEKAATIRLKTDKRRSWPSVIGARRGSVSNGNCPQHLL
jgi:hypothetical protein